jgi:hypothetical protein
MIRNRVCYASLIAAVLPDCYISIGRNWDATEDEVRKMQEMLEYLIRRSLVPMTMALGNFVLRGDTPSYDVHVVGDYCDVITGVLRMFYEKTYKYKHNTRKPWQPRLDMHMVVDTDAKRALAENLVQGSQGRFIVTDTKFETNLDGELSHLPDSHQSPAKVHKKAPQTYGRFFNHLGRPGDWYCPMCNVVNFAFRKECNKCGTTKPVVEIPEEQ